MATLCLAGKNSTSALLVCDRAASLGKWTTQFQFQEEKKAAKLVATQTEDGTAGVAGAGNAQLIGRLVEENRAENRLRDLSTLTEVIAQQGEHATWELVSRFEQLEEHLPEEERDDLLDRWEDSGKREEIERELAGGLRKSVQSMADSRFLYVRVGEAGPEIYQAGAFGTLVRKHFRSAAAIGSGKVALKEWKSQFGLPSGEESITDVAVDLLSIYSLGLDTAHVSGAPVIRILRRNGVSQIPSSDEAVLVNLAGCYLAGHLSRGALQESVQFALEGEPPTEKNGFVEEKARRIGVEELLLRAEGRGRGYWLRRTGAPERTGTQVGPHGVFAEDLQDREGEARVEKEFGQMTERLNAARSELNNPLSDWDLEEPGASPESRKPEDFMRFLTNYILTEASAPKLWSRTLTPLLRRADGDDPSRTIVDIALYLSALWHAWPEWTERYFGHPSFNLIPITFIDENPHSKPVSKRYPERFVGEVLREIEGL